MEQFGYKKKDRFDSILSEFSWIRNAEAEEAKRKILRLRDKQDWLEELRTRCRYQNFDGLEEEVADLQDALKKMADVIGDHLYQEVVRTSRVGRNKNESEKEHLERKLYLMEDQAKHLVQCHCYKLAAKARDLRRPIEERLEELKEEEGDGKGE